MISFSRLYGFNSQSDKNVYGRMIPIEWQFALDNFRQFFLVGAVGLHLAKPEILTVCSNSETNNEMFFFTF